MTLYMLTPTVCTHSIECNCVKELTVTVLGAISLVHWSVVELDSHFLFCCGACTLCVQTVITISSKSGQFLPLDQKVNEAVREGITVVVAGGNDDDDACKYSPGTSPHAITVGEYYVLQCTLQHPRPTHTVHTCTY